MANPTSNFNWQMPTSSDLVTDLPADFEVFGQAVDTSLADLKGGTTGQVLAKATNTNMDFNWVTPAGGKVLQVVQATTTTATTINSTSYTDSGLSATITPTLATSKILVLVNQRVYITRNNDSVNMASQVLRGATVVYLQEFASQIYASGSTALTVLGAYVNSSYLDSPATTSATTYKTQGKLSSTADSASLIYQQNSAISSIILMEIGA